MYSTPILAMLDFFKIFIIESDVFGVGLDAIFMGEIWLDLLMKRICWQ